MVPGQVHMRWHRRLLLRMLRLLLFTKQAQIPTTCAATTAVSHAQPILWPAAAHVLIGSTDVRSCANVRAATNVRRRGLPWRSYESVRSTKGCIQRRRASCFPYAHPRSPVRRCGARQPAKPTSRSATRTTFIKRQRRLLRPWSTIRWRRSGSYECCAGAQLRLSPAVCSTVSLQPGGCFASPEPRYEREVNAV